jgi:hypothetical protein
MLDYTDKEYWNNVRESIYNKRSEHEKEICSKYFIQLNEADQQLSMKLEEREESEFLKAMGFEKGKYVVNSQGEKFKVQSHMDLGGMLDIDKISVYLGENYYDGFSICSRNNCAHGLKEGQYFDNYMPVAEYEYIVA